MKVLVACEYSGIVRREFSRLGHYAVSCDLLPTEKKGRHYQGNVLDIINEGWDLMIAHPPCTFLSNAGSRWIVKNKERIKDVQKGAAFFNALMNCNIPRIAIENPVPHKWALQFIGRKYDQKIQPWQFGKPESKGVCLWLKNLPKLQPTKNVKHLMKHLPRRITHRVLYTPESKDQKKKRSIFFKGIARAMAEQWGIL